MVGIAMVLLGGYMMMNDVLRKIEGQRKYPGILSCQTHKYQQSVENGRDAPQQCFSDFFAQHRRNFFWVEVQNTHRLWPVSKCPCQSPFGRVIQGCSGLFTRCPGLPCHDAPSGFRKVFAFLQAYPATA
jgi:hypothetical protein